MKKLPIGKQTLRKVFEDNCVYADKTSFAEELITSPIEHYFLSRPRRFGKSLFLDTLKEIFEGNKELFEGCHIYNSSGYHWEKHPVIFLDFSQIPNESSEMFKIGLKEVLEEVARSWKISIIGSSPQALLRSLVKELSKQNRVVVLVDEYDKPIIDRLNDLDVAKENRDVLSSFFGVLKSLDAQLRFSFITGVSKFSHVSIFSGGNNLTDLTMKPEYAGILGFTEKELKEHFSEHIQSIAQKRSQLQVSVTEKEILDEMRTWYNGYRFSQKKTYVYNPLSTLNFLNDGVSKAYWYVSGTPSFLIDQAKKHPESMVSLEGITTREEDLMDISSFDDIGVPALMYQTGYFTIKEYFEDTDSYQLGFPNKEVKSSFIGSLTKNFVPRLDSTSSVKLIQAMENQQLAPFFKHLEMAIASFANTLFAGAKESTYHIVVLSIMHGMGLYPLSERSTNKGRIDVVLEMSKAIYIIEIKLDRTPEEALKQIHNQGYFKPYTQQGKEIVLVGANFSSETRNISGWKGEVLSESGSFIRQLK